MSEQKTKCFSCANDAVAMVSCCSPTSATGLTEIRPKCEECIGNMRGIVNIMRFLVPQTEFDKRIKSLVKNKHGIWVKPKGGK